MILCLGLLIAFPVVHDAKEGWTRFRGPNGSGVTENQNLPIDSKPSIRWNVAIPGEGSGSPVVDHGKVYLQSASADGKERIAICLDSSTGKTIWQKSVAGSGSKTHKKNNLASGTPAVSGDTVVFCFWNGKDLELTAFDSATGSQRWVYPLGAFSSQHGAGHSPIIVDRLAVIACDQDHRSEVVAVHLETGKLAWKAERKAFRACYSTPIVRRIVDDKLEIIIESTAGLTGYDAQSGKVNWDWIWKFDKAPLRTVSSPILTENGVIIASAGDGGGDRHTIALSLPSKNDQKPKIVWELKRGIPYVPCLLNCNAGICYVADNGVAGCLDAKTGSTLWSARLTGNVSASPLMIDGHVWAATEEGIIHVFDVDKNKMTKLAQYDLAETIFATPASAEGKLFIRTKGHLVCVGK